MNTEKLIGLPDWVKKKYEDDYWSAKERKKEEVEDMRKNVEKYMEKWGIKKRYLSASLENIKIQGQPIEKVKNFLEGKGKEGLFITGSVGAGKTYLACAIARELIKQGVITYFKSVPQLFMDLRTCYNSDNKYREEEIINRFINVECLILDDLGAEKTSDWTIDRLYLIIDGRYTEIRKTIITSNLSIDNISVKKNFNEQAREEREEDFIYDRLASRIYEMCEIVILPKKDYRLEKKNE